MSRPTFLRVLTGARWSDDFQHTERPGSAVPHRIVFFEGSRKRLSRSTNPIVANLSHRLCSAKYCNLNVGAPRRLDITPFLSTVLYADCNPKRFVVGYAIEEGVEAHPLR